MALPGTTTGTGRSALTVNVYGFDLTIAYVDTNLDVPRLWQHHELRRPRHLHHQQVVLRHPTDPAGLAPGLQQGLVDCHLEADEGRATDLVVVGAGLNGSFWRWRRRRGRARHGADRPRPPIPLVDPAFDGRTTALAYTSQRLFEALGMWPDIAEHAEPIPDIRISDAGHDGRASPLFLHFDHREAGTDGDGELAPMGWIVENRFLRAALLRRLAPVRTSSRSHPTM